MTSSSEKSRAPAMDEKHELTICDITGAWGPYQWSICMFAFIYSAMLAITVVSGPIWTPHLEHICITDEQSSAGFQADPSSYFKAPTLGKIYQCSPIMSNGSTPPQAPLTDPLSGSSASRCSKFIYNDQEYGKLLTNSFDLVCDRAWLRSFVSSSALLGMLISSVTLGLVSDRFGRLRCIQVGFYLAVAANLIAIFSHNYLLLNICIFFMSYAQVGAANALCTMLMETTTPKLRIVAIFEYGLGWGLGVFVVPLMNQLTRDYRYFLAIQLVCQLLLWPWLHWGLRESIRWLLSEGYVNRAQIELRWVCQRNGVETGTSLAKNIAQIQVQQMRRASRIIEAEEAPVKLAKALESEVRVAARELDMLSSAIRDSFGLNETDEENSNQLASTRSPEAQREQQQSQQAGIRKASHQAHQLLQNYPSAKPRVSIVPPITVETTSSSVDANLCKLELMSPTLARKSFSISVNPPIDAAAASEYLQQKRQQQQQLDITPSKRSRASSLAVPNQQSGLPVTNLEQAELELARRGSLTTQGLIQLAMKYSKTVEQADEPGCFLVRMFHPKLWSSTVTLALAAVMSETTYYGLIQANKFVGSNVGMNYMTGAVSEWLSAIVSAGFMVILSRRSALMLPTLAASAACLAMALSYHLLPEGESSLIFSDATMDRMMSTILEPLPNGQLVVPESEFNASVNTSTTSELLLQHQDNSSSLLEHPLNHHHLNQEEQLHLIEVRDHINMLMMNVGKFSVAVAIQVSATIAIEVYPNNLRQTAFGSLQFMGRCGSIVAPFLFNDPSENKLMLRMTLIGLAALGLLICLVVPCALRDQKDKELCDHMNEIESDDES